MFFFLPCGVDLEQVKIGETAAIKGFGAEVRARVVSFVNKLEGWAGTKRRHTYVD